MTRETRCPRCGAVEPTYPSIDEMKALFGGKLTVGPDDIVPGILPPHVLLSAIGARDTRRIAPKGNA